MSENAEKEETPLLKLVMKEGKRLEERESLTTIQKRTRNSVFNLPDPIRNIDSAHNYLVKISAKLESLRKSLSVQ
jgi:nicotinate phosphoribosyltransferase